MRVGVETIVSYLPEEKVAAADYAYLRQSMPPWMSIPREKRRFADPHANEIMAVKVAQKALGTAGLGSDDIDLIVCQSFGGRLIVPALAGFLHKQLSFPRHVPAWNIQDICASFLDGCEIASNAIKSGGEYKRALVVAVSALETGGWGSDTTHFSAACLGDGAAAAIVGSERLRGEFLAYNNETYGEIYEAAALGLDRPLHPELVSNTKWILNKACGPHLGPDFDELLETVLSRMVVDALTNACRKASLRLSDLDLIVAHQAFSGLLEIWQRALEPLGVARDRWRSTWDRYGNVGACDVAVTLADLVAENQLAAGARIALFAPGGGGHTPTIIMRWLR